MTLCCLRGCVCVYELFIRVLITISLLPPRFLHVRSADVSQVERCCVLWQRARRQSVWTRSMNRISAAQSARVVSQDNFNNIRLNTLLQYNEYECSSAGCCWVAPLEQTRVKGFCSRAPQQELWGQGSATLILLTQSTQHAALTLQRLQSLALSECIFELMRSISMKLH